MSVSPVPRDSAVEAVAGLMAAASLFVSSIAVVYRPIRVAPFAIIVALIASGMGGRHARLAAIAVAVGGICFYAGMVVAVITSHPIY